MWKRFTSAIALLTILSGCSTMTLFDSSLGTSKSGKPNSTAPKPAIKLFQQSLKAMSKNKLKVAEERLLSLTGQYPEYASPFTNLGIVHALNEMDSLAEEAFLKAISIEPKNCAPYVQLGLLQRKRFNFDQAEQAYLRCLSIDPDYSNAHLNLGILYEIYQGKLSAALGAYEKYQSLLSEPDKRVAVWIADLSRRIKSVSQIAAGAKR
jgi:tetratricopeptide (TPR) repeat protein